MSKRYVFVPLTSDEAAVGRVHSTQIIRAHVTGLRHAKSNAIEAMKTMQPWTVTPYTPWKRSDGEYEERSLPSRSDANEPEMSTSGLNHRRNREEDRSVPADDPVSTFLGSARLADPFWTYPVEYQSSLSPIFTHYIENLAVDIPDLDGVGQRGLLRRRWFPLAMTEPSSMYAVLLLAATHYTIVNPSHLHQIDLLSLKARALAEINSVLESSRALSDAAIGAVMKMAAYEAIFGETTAYAAHMRGLKLMIQMRGGLGELGLDGLLERMIVWIDLNAAYLTGSTRTIGDKDIPTTVNFSGPDPFHFAGVS